MMVEDDLEVPSTTTVFERDLLATTWNVRCHDENDKECIYTVHLNEAPTAESWDTCDCHDSIYHPEHPCPHITYCRRMDID